MPKNVRPQMALIMASIPYLYLVVNEMIPKNVRPQIAQIAPKWQQNRPFIYDRLFIIILKLHTVNNINAKIKQTILLTTINS